MSSPLKQNTTIIQELLTKINNLPEASSGVELPELTNPATTSELFLNKELIDSEGNKVTGTFTIDSELSTQDDLIAQIQSALQNKAAGSEPVLQDKTVTPSTSQQSITADSGYDGLSKVTVNAMPTATQATPSISVSSSGLVTASATQTAGYVTAGTKSGTKQLTTQAAKTVTPSTSSQTAVAKDVYTTGAVTVAAIPNTYVKPIGTLDVTENGEHDVKNYASVNVNVASGDSAGGGAKFYEETFTPSGSHIFTHNLGAVPTRFYILVDWSIAANNTSMTRTAACACGTALKSSMAFAAMPSGVTQVIANTGSYVINGSNSAITADSSTLTYNPSYITNGGLNTTLVYKIFIFVD